MSALTPFDPYISLLTPLGPLDHLYCLTKHQRTNQMLPLTLWDPLTPPLTPQDPTDLPFDFLWPLDDPSGSVGQNQVDLSRPFGLVNVSLKKRLHFAFCVNNERFRLEFVTFACFFLCDRLIFAFLTITKTMTTNLFSCQRKIQVQFRASLASYRIGQTVATVVWNVRQC